jgi:hypothetical protein
MKSQDKAKKKFIAVVEEDQVDKINDIAANMKKEGAKVSQVLSFSGIITGTSPDLEKLCKVAGVKSIEEDRENFAL